MASRVLLLFAHPAAHRSRINTRMLAKAREIEGVTVRELYQIYPRFDIDPDVEQALLLEHDTLVFQHPLYWYSSPSLLKEWEDITLEHGWAYGSGGHQLHGKRLMSAVTMAAPEDAYTEQGANRHTVEQLLAPFNQTARFCGMTWLEPFKIFSSHELDEAGLDREAARYHQRLIELTQEDPR